LGESIHALTFLTLSFEGVSLEVPPNQFTKKRMKKSQKQFKNIKHTRNITNENVTHVKSRRHET
jgi:hypothetical protein